MKTADIYLKPSCSTCRDAVADLERRGVSLTKHDIQKELPPAAELKRIVAKAGVERFLNPRGTTFKARGIKLDGLADDDAMALVAGEPNLMKRPLVVAGERFVFGFDRKAYEELFGPC